MNVFGQIGSWTVGNGTYAEYTIAAVTSIARRPPDLDAEFAAALPQTGVSALQLIDAASPRPDANVVVLGATGGIGSILLQLLARRQAKAIAVTRASNDEYARSLGASTSLDYETVDVPRELSVMFPSGIDGVFDLVGDGELNRRMDELIRPGGHLVSMRGGADIDTLHKRGVTGVNIATQVTSERLERLVQLVRDGSIRRPEILLLPLDEAPSALERIGAGHTRGKLVLSTRAGHN